MHLIYSKLKSLNTLNGMVIGDKKNKGFTVDFKPEVTTEVSDDQYDALMNDKGGIFESLHKSGDFIESVEKSTNDIAMLEGNLVKAQRALDNAREALKENDIVDGVKTAEDALALAEKALGKAANAEEKKAALADVKDAKKALVDAKKEVKKGK